MLLKDFKRLGEIISVVNIQGNNSPYTHPMSLRWSKKKRIYADADQSNQI